MRFFVSPWFASLARHVRMFLEYSRGTEHWPAIALIVPEDQPQIKKSMCSKSHLASVLGVVHIRQWLTGWPDRSRLCT
mgnify:CR=1 FL=1